MGAAAWRFGLRPPMGDSPLTDAVAQVALSSPENRGGGIYRYERYRVELDGASLERDVVRIGRVVVIVPVDLDRDEVVLIRQFRLGAHLALGLGDLIELPAGRVERDEDVADAARRECQEEIGVTPRTLVPIFDVMPSAGSSDEHMHFFLGVIDASMVPERAGAAHEQEDTRPLRVPIVRALDALNGGNLHYGAAVLGLQWLALNRARLREIVAR
jgi:ADP-ribose pyrophosphatase